MRFHRFFLKESIGTNSSVIVSDYSFINQLKNVFRLVKGDQIIIFDNSGYDFTATIDGYEKDSVSLAIIENHKNMILPTRETYLFVSIVKKDNFEWIAEKATELGVSHIIPIVSERSEKKDINIERINKIIIEAAEQSGRGTIPVLCQVTDLTNAIIKYAHIKSVAWDPFATKFSSKDVDSSLGAYIGPEGGWSHQELNLFKQHGIEIRSLGPQVLRSETAVIAVISRLVF